MTAPPSSTSPAALAGLIVGPRGPVDFDDPATIADLSVIRDEVVAPALNARRGQLVEAAEVDLMVRFETILEALEGALAIQAAMKTRKAPGGQGQNYAFRFGLDVCDGVEPNQSVAGIVAASCEPGEVWVSEAAEAALHGHTAVDVQPCWARPLGPDGQMLQVFRFGPEREVADVPSRPASPPRFSVGKGVVLNDTYRIESLIAQGGMGEVFKGHEIHSGGVVAVKLLRPDMSSNKTALGLFQKEALILKDIYHDAIVRYFTFSFDAALQRHYLAMEFVDGVSLAEVLKKGPLPFEAVCTLRSRIATALFVAHERGIIHRDMSPDNIIIPGGDVARAKVIDFGIARAEIGGGTLIGGGFAGKYNYVSPEQLGLAGGQITPQSDIYSLGLVLAESSLGRALNMTGSEAENIEKRRVVPDLSAIDERLRPLIANMLQPLPENRPRSMAAVAEWPVPGLARSHAAVPQGDRDDTGHPSRGVGGSRSRFRWTLGLGAAALVVLIGAGAGLRKFAFTDHQRTASSVPHDNFTGPAVPASSSVEPPVPADNPAKVGQPQTAKVEPATAPATVSPPPAAPSPEATPEVGNTALPPSRPASTASADPAAAMTAFIKGYADNPCFFAQPVQLSPTSATIEAFAQSRDDFTAFDRAFNAKFGVSPEIAGYRIWSRQCPALEFAHRLASGSTERPRLLLKSMRVGSGQPISGEIRNGGDVAVTLLQVGDDGTVRDVSDKLQAAGNALTFDLPNDARGSPAPQLLIALASPQPLAAMSKTAPATSDKFFPALAREAATSGQAWSLDAKLFLLGG